MEKFLKYNIQVKETSTYTSDYGVFIFSPLEKGFGQTIGNSLRRLLLSNVLGHALFAIKVPGITHEFQPLQGVKEDLTQIILNLKQLVIKIDQEIFGEKEQQETSLEKWPTLKINAGSGVVKGSDIETPVGFEIINKEMVIANVEEGHKLRMELYAKTGKGFVPFNENRDDINTINVIATDSKFSPVLKVGYKVNEIKTSKKTTSDELVLELLTNGAISAAEAIAMSSKILAEHFSLITTELNEGFNHLKFMSSHTETGGRTTSSISASIDELELSVRSYNCLKRAGIHTITQLIDKTRTEIENIRNLGKKSYKEILKKIKERNLKLKEQSEE